MILEALSLVGICFIGTIVWVFSPEATAVLYGSQERMPALVVGALCTLGQCSMFALLYFLGGELTERWSWMKKNVDKTKTRFADQLERSFLTMSVSAGVIGIPPAIAISALAKGFGLRLLPFLSCIAIGRFGRFTLLAAGGEEAMKYFAAAPPLSNLAMSLWNQIATL
tara:strand:- start:404 stop:907 length:504 start_codon:yes stop_codon:yes gene_type:complete